MWTDGKKFNGMGQEAKGKNDSSWKKKEPIMGLFCIVGVVKNGSELSELSKME